jgi:hypothetical protein
MRLSLAFAAVLLLGAVSTPSWAGDLSKYRSFQFGTDLATVAGQAGLSPSQAKVIHSRPALMQDLEWRPRPIGSSSQTESASDVVFSFYNGALYRIEVNYDRYEMEGMTAEDIVNAVSATYGTAVKPAAPAQLAEERYGEREEAVARWQDPRYSFDLIRYSYGPTFKLIGVLKRLEAPAQAAILEAARLDEQEAPQRDAERIVTEQQTERAKLEKARLVNIPRFRP